MLGSGKGKYNCQDILKIFTFTMAWHVDSNAEFRTDPQKPAEIQVDHKTLSNKIYTVRKRSLLLTSQKSRQNKRRRTVANGRVIIVSRAIQP